MSGDFEVTLRVHQGSMLSPLQFIAVMQYVTESARSNDITDLLYADGIALSGGTVEEVLAKYHTRKTETERKGLKVNVG